MLLLHVGDHTRLHLHELVAHMFGPAHLGLAAIVALLAGAWIHARVRRARAKSAAKRDRTP